MTDVRHDHRAAPPGVRAGASGPRRRGRLSWRVALGLTAVIVLAVASVLAAGSGRRMPLDPDDPGPDGSRAIAHVLADRGVDVRTARSTAELRAAVTEHPEETTVVVPGADLLPASSLQTLSSLESAARLVLVTPSAEVLGKLRIDARPAGRSRSTLVASCDTAVLDPADELAAGAALYRTSRGQAATCFPDEDDDAAADAGAYLDVPAAGSRPATTVLGQPEVFANVGITRKAHAAIAMRLLAGGERVVWFVPPPAEDDPPLGTPGSVDPPAWALPVLVLVTLTLLALALWRGRRLGPLVTEPLPVAVPADETTRARARLYRRAGDPDAIARILRDAAADDLRQALRLRPDSELTEIARAVAAALPDTTADDVHALLTRPVPERELLAHARELRRLRRKVRTS